MRQLKLIYLFLGLFVPILSFSPLQAGNLSATDPGQPDNTLTLKSTTFTPNSVNINYEIPYGGMVLFFLFDEEGEMIWRTQNSRERGENSIQLKAAKFDQGKKYTFTIEYKGHSYTGAFEGR